MVAGGFLLAPNGWFVAYGEPHSSVGADTAVDDASPPDVLSSLLGARDVRFCVYPRE